MLGALTGLQAEARLLRPYCPIIMAGGGGSAPDQTLVRAMLARGATALLSVGVCGGWTRRSPWAP